jgi:hypothetical protein
METRKLTGAEAIVEGLIAHDIDTVFALPGAQIYGLTDALAKNKVPGGPMGQSGGHTGRQIRTIGALQYN